MKTLHAALIIFTCVAIGVAFYLSKSTEKPEAGDSLPSAESPVRAEAVNAIEDTQKSIAQRYEEQFSPLVADRVLQIQQPKSPSWWHNATLYQVWVRSFYDADGDGNGDLAGLTAKLDYIKSLGVDGIWISPIFASPSYHGYDTSDYREVNKDFGTMEDFDALIEAAKEKNIKIILDLVVNHVSEFHPWFQKSLMNDSKYGEYFVWQNSLPTGHTFAWSNEGDPRDVWHTKSERNGYYYGAFGWTQPDLNFYNPSVVNEIKAIASFWLNKGVDGFRLDAIRYLYEDGESGAQSDTSATLDFWTKFSAHVRTINPNALLIGEALTETKKIAQYYDQGRGIDQAFDFGFNYFLKGFLEKAKKSSSGVNDDENLEKYSSIRDVLWEYFERQHERENTPGFFFASFANSHDHNRLSLALNGDTNRAKIAAALLLTTPGTRFIYYGEEIGMGQYSDKDDSYRRSIMQWNDSDTAGFNSTNKRWIDESRWFFWIEDFKPWWQVYWREYEDRKVANVARQETQKDSLLRFYRNLIHIRQKDSVINAPDQMGIYNSTGAIWAVKYQRGRSNRIVLINLDPEEKREFDAPEVIFGEYENLLQGDQVELGNVPYSLNPGEVLVLQSSSSLK